MLLKGDEYCVGDILFIYLCFLLFWFLKLVDYCVVYFLSIEIVFREIIVKNVIGSNGSCIIYCRFVKFIVFVKVFSIV